MQIALSGGFFALVDDQDAWVSSHKWSVARCGDKIYARRSKAGRHVYLHREVLGFSPKDPEVDHKDGDGLNCTRDNLRPVSHAINARNSKVRSDNKSGFRGVSFSKKTGKWAAHITIAGQQTWLGYHLTIEAARTARASAEIQLFGVEPQRAEEIRSAMSCAS